MPSSLTTPEILLQWGSASTPSTCRGRAGLSTMPPRSGSTRKRSSAPRSEKQISITSTLRQLASRTSVKPPSSGSVRPGGRSTPRSSGKTPAPRALSMSSPQLTLNEVRIVFASRRGSRSRATSQPQRSLGSLIRCRVRVIGPSAVNCSSEPQIPGFYGTSPAAPRVASTRPTSRTRHEQCSCASIPSPGMTNSSPPFVCRVRFSLRSAPPRALSGSSRQHHSCTECPSPVFSVINNLPPLDRPRLMLANQKTRMARAAFSCCKPGRRSCTRAMDLSRPLRTSSTASLRTTRLRVRLRLRDR